MAVKLGGGDDDLITDINITPFVDIILVVLIIFMVTATAIAKMSIKVTLPEAATGEAAQDVSLGLALDTSGQLYLDGQTVTEDGVRTKIREVKAEGKEVVCLIAADKDVRHGEVVELIDLVKQEGVVKFALNIDPVAMPAAAAGAAPAPTPVTTVP